MKTALAPLLGEEGGNHPLARYVDHDETYGAHVVKKFLSTLQHLNIVVDLGPGHGRDLGIVKQTHPYVQTCALEAGSDFAAELVGKVDKVQVLDIERAIFPFPDESVDLFIANQVLEHTKEIFWIFHEVTRCLRVGGHFLFGVPNIASLHNRLLLLFGTHPTQHKLCSAHVRPFSKADTVRFLDACFPDGYRLEKFGGSQFYPFPPKIARLMTNIFPTGAFSIFFLLRKCREYKDEFASYPSRAKLATNFWTGNVEIADKWQSY
ncbi:MAG: class I SAM-dependent methyltransferase [Bryobacteraceae bacterium]